MSTGAEGNRELVRGVSLLARRGVEALLDSLPPTDCGLDRSEELLGGERLRQVVVRAEGHALAHVFAGCSSGEVEEGDSRGPGVVLEPTFFEHRNFDDILEPFWCILLPFGSILAPS